MNALPVTKQRATHEINSHVMNDMLSINLAGTDTAAEAYAKHGLADQL
jgi:hypothetical protein